MAHATLSPVQRESLITHLARRLRKLTDSALIELERSTRHPERLSNPTARQVGKAAASPQPQGNIASVRPSEQVTEVAGRDMSRRELLAYCTGGALALLAASTGYGWAHSQSRSAKYLTLFHRIETHDLDQIVSEAMEDLGQLINSLTSLIESTFKEMESHDAILWSYRSSYISTQQNIDQMVRVTEQTRNLYNSLLETGMNIPTILQEIFRLFSLIPEAGDFFIPDVEELADALDIMLEIVKNTPTVIETAEFATTDLQVWFSADQGQGIDARLLQPLHDTLFEHMAEIRTQANTLQQTWTQTLTEPTGKVIQERERIRSEIIKLN